MQESPLNLSASKSGIMGQYALGALAIVALIFLIGCSSTSAPPERYDAAKSAQLAFETYDVNKDGTLSAQELKQSPALESAMNRLDKDNSGSVSAEEISQRIQAYESQSNFVGVMVQLKSGRHPVEMATVTFEPESFMGANFQSFTGVSSSGGVVNLVGQEKQTPGLPLGFYRVTIKRDGGAETIHGCEIADDVPSAGRMNIAL